MVKRAVEKVPPFHAGQVKSEQHLANAKPHHRTPYPRTVVMAVRILELNRYFEG